jgi:hypothetical protein
LSSGVSLRAIAIIATRQAVAINVMVVNVARALVVVSVEQRESSLPVAMSLSSRLSHRRPRRALPIVPLLPVCPRPALPIVARQVVAIVVTRQARADGSAADPNASRAKRAPLPPLCHRRSRLVSGPTLTQSEQSEVDFVARCSLRRCHHRLRRCPSRRRHHHHSVVVVCHVVVILSHRADASLPSSSPIGNGTPAPVQSDGAPPG